MYEPYDPQTANTQDRVAWMLCQIIDDDAPLSWTRYRGVAECIARNKALMDNLNVLAVSGGTFQDRVQPWMLACFGPRISADKVERNYRFLEEALELVQACGCSQNEAHQLVDYVYGRPVGEPSQEVGSVMVTLAALCLAQDLNMHADGESELARIWTKIEQIRAKQASKTLKGPLP